MTNGANDKGGKLHHSPWHSDIRTSNQLNSGSKVVTVVRVSMLELWVQACQSHGSQSVHLSELTKQTWES